MYYGLCFMNILGGMDTATSGEIIVDGVHIEKYSQKKLTLYRRETVGFVFQFYNLVQNLTARENVELATQICSRPYDPDQVLELVGLADRKKNFPAQLSGGEQQRVSIARALAKNPKLMHNAALKPMADRIVTIKNGRIADSVRNPEPVSIEKIEW